MAQLFQPTNITPDTRGSFGNGVVLIDPAVTVWEDYMPVSWQVNGNVPMTAFKIDVTDMDGNSLYSTGKLTAGCPFYGTASDGSVRRFSYIIVQSDISTSFLREASEGLVRITQWWGSSDSDKVVQASPSPYLVRQSLIASWTVSGGQPVTGRGATFTGTFTGAETDGLMWIRWVLESVTYERGRITSRQTVKDTGRLYGCVEPTFSYDRFLPGDYWLTLTGETSAGVMSGDDGDILHVSYALEENGMAIEACKAPGGESAVLVRWARPVNIPATTETGEIRDLSSILILMNGSEIGWDTVNGHSMSLEKPWSFVWAGGITQNTGKLFEIGMSDGRTIDLTFVWNEKANLRSITFAIRNGGATEHWFSLYPWYTEGPFFFCLTETRIVMQYRRVSYYKPLYPKDTLFPSDTLYPGTGPDEVLVTETYERVFADEGWTYEQANVSSVSVFGESSISYVKLVDHEIQPDQIPSYMSGDSQKTFDVSTLFLATSGHDLNAGNVSYNSAMTGLALYRRAGEENVLAPVGSVYGTSVRGMMDYGARSQGGPYTYYLYVLTANQAESTPAVSDGINPCFWNWTVLSCERDEDGEYTVKKSFLFGLNLSSGSISNSNRPNIMQNFTPYPIVQMAAQNYKTGTLQGLIGAVDYSTGEARYSDSTDLMETIWDLSVTTNYLFLKDRKGSLRMIRPSGEITMTTMDGTREQAQTVNFPWVEIGDASEAQIRTVI